MYARCLRYGCVKKLTWLAICWQTMILSAYAKDDTNTAPVRVPTNAISGRRRLRPLMFTTQAYRKEALRLVIREANNVALALNLPEDLPIKETNLVETFIGTPQLARLGIGNIRTSNYIYYMSVGDKFSSLVRTDSELTLSQLKAEYLWPVSRLDTNNAYQMATQWLYAVSMDVQALNRDCKVVIHPWMPEGVSGSNFVPLYRVYWVAKSGDAQGSVAGVELVEPTRSLQQLYVKKSQYILRKPLVITNLGWLLAQTNSLTNAAPQTGLIH